MAFDAIVEITGVCAYVPLKNGQIMVVLPDARKARGELAPHKSVACWPSYISNRPRPDDIESYRYTYLLNRERVILDPHYEGPEPPFEACLPTLPKFGDALADSKFNKIRSDAIRSDKKTSDKVLGQILISSGKIDEFRPRGSGEEWRWTSESAANAKNYCPGITVRLQRVEAFRLKLVDFESKKERYLKLKPYQTGQALKVILGNLDATPTNSNTLVNEDIDIKWLYDLCNKRGKLPSEGERPHLVRETPGKDPSRTCFGVQMTT